MKTAIVLFAAAFASQAGAAAQRFTPVSFPSRLLTAHNLQRAAVGLPSLVWDDNLAKGAADWAQRMALTGNFEHSNRRARPGIGENLWSGSRGAYSLEAMVGLWAMEKRNFIAGAFPNVSRTGNWYDVSHYTQVIWPATRRVGCALASTYRADYLVCRYSPAGNIDGRFVP